MMLEQLCHTVESAVHGLKKRLRGTNPAVELRDEAHQLSTELQQGYAALKRHQAEREALSRRLVEHEADAAMLASHVETYVHVNDPVNAWRHALELDGVREALNQDRARLRLHDHRHSRQRAHLEQLEGRLASVLEKLYPR